MPKHRAQTAVLSVTPRLAQHPLTRRRVAAIRAQAEAHGRQIYFDFGPPGPPSGVDPAVCVFDPLWFKTRPWSAYWKIHGWHPERWVRLYSAAELAGLVETARRHSPEFVIFAHSQRYEQWQQTHRHFLNEEPLWQANAPAPSLV